ncbi:MAG: Gfo/Idh/MocA family oxidoreductase [Sedimentisphaerales bacterium]|nr:Gfo/Idh/MocA family oxidoreductase [Sedimentisphaerales bacterium]
MCAKKSKTLNVALIGRGFMGRTHSNAWGQVGRFFDTAIKPVMHTACDNVSEGIEEYAAKWGWQKYELDFHKVCADPEVDLVDLGTPNFIHADMAVDALEHGKHVACEKPLAGSLDDARRMVEAARKSKSKTFVWFCYRRCPAVAFAHQLVKAGKIGKIRHVRGYYLQCWADESVPLAWRFDKKLAGSGAHGDLNAHIVDMTRFVTGEEIVSIDGAIAETFIKERSKMTGNVSGSIAGGLQKAKAKGKVTVDDTVLFLARFSGGAVASFEAARQATGNQNKNGFEINGTKGSIKFDFERMGELEYYDATLPEDVRGWSTINCTHAGSHPYIDAWWPDAHGIGYEHTFTNMAYDILRVLDGKKPVVPLPDFEDAYITQRVLEAAMVSAAEKRFVKVSEIK